MRWKVAAARGQFGVGLVELIQEGLHFRLVRAQVAPEAAQCKVQVRVLMNNDK